MEISAILDQLPYQKPFLFVDELLTVNTDGAIGYYTYHKDLDFYKGHFKDQPITPGVILIETMAQIGLVCLGIYLLDRSNLVADQIWMTSADVDYLKPVSPGEKVKVISTKNYFRFNKLQCKVVMENASGEAVCRGVLSGMFSTKANG